MAELKGNVMGIFKGKIGKISGRVKNGKNYFVSLPAEFNPSMTPEAVARREKFKVTAKLAKAIQKDEILKSIWINEENINSSVYTHVLKFNYNFLINNSPSIDNLITPDNGFNPNVTALSYADGTISVSVGALENILEINPETEQFIQVHGIIFADEPVSTSANELFMYENFVSEKLPIDLQNPTEFSINLGYKKKRSIAKYGSLKILLAVITTNNEQQYVQYSHTHFADNL